MSIADYNLEKEELCLESYLRRTTAIGIKRQDGDDDGGNPTFDNGIVDENDNGRSNSDDDDDGVGKRVFCCKTSRSLYCPECCKVLIPSSFWPKGFIREQHQRNKTSRRRQRSSFPFRSMDIVLGVKERRTSSTGIQMMCIANMISEAVEASSSQKLNNHRDQQLRQQLEGCNISNNKTDASNSASGGDDVVDDEHNVSNKDSEWWRNVTLYDLNRGDALPMYSNVQVSEKKNSDNDEPSLSDVVDDSGTYVLFPQEGKSVPISSVAKNIKKLVVLDIKWTRSYNVKLFSADHHKINTPNPSHRDGANTYNPLSPLNDLPFVHLEFPPQKSNFWRWHNRGDGMLSTIEAIYFAAREVSVALEQKCLDHGKEQAIDDTFATSRGQEGRLGVMNEEKKERFIDILWLFALQRSIIQERSIQEGRPAAFSEEAKALARALRQQELRLTQ